MKTIKKKWPTILWFIVLILFLICFRFYWQEKDIVKSYNLGNRLYKLGMYDLAEQEYDWALYFKPSKKQQCSVRINKALAMVTPLTPESVTYENLEETLDTLNQAIDLLVADGCAHRDDNDGHNETAQTLKNEIDDYIEWLQENVQPPEEEEPEEEKEQETQEDPEDEEDQQLKELREKFEAIEQEGMQERNSDLQQYENYFHDYEFFDGKKW